MIRGGHAWGQRGADTMGAGADQISGIELEDLSRVRIGVLTRGQDRNGSRTKEDRFCRLLYFRRIDLTVTHRRSFKLLESRENAFNGCSEPPPRAHIFAEGQRVYGGSGDDTIRHGGGEFLHRFFLGEQ